MTMRAVVFDFFGTLTDPAAEPLRREVFGATAAALGLPADDFWAVMGQTFAQRIVGAFGDTRETLRAVAALAGREVTPEELDAGVAAHHHGAIELRRPRAGGLAVLDELRSAGLRLGLLSDCSSELAEAWAGTAYAERIDAPVFSWQERRRKPDPVLYATVAQRLGVAPQECWYVGDGGSRELQGARAAGMHPVLVTNAAWPLAAAHRTDPDPFIPEFTIDDLHRLPGLLGLSAQIRP
jgi:putative hydrolase of the HAD superfamily